MIAFGLMGADWYLRLYTDFILRTAGVGEHDLSHDKLAIIAAFVITAISGSVFLLAPDLILRFISATPEMIEVGRPAYRILALPLFVSGVSIVMSQSFPPAKRSYLTMIYTMLRQVGIMIPLCMIGGRRGGMTGIWIGYAATDYIALLVVIVMTIWFMKNVINKLEKDKK